MTTNIRNCDLVVLGAGGAGLLAAVKATDMGVRNVVIVEKAKRAGGCTWFCGAVPRKQNSTAEQLDDRFRSTMKNLWWKVNPKLIRNVLNAGGPCYDWFSKICDLSDYPQQAPGQQGAASQGSVGMNATYHMNKNSRDPSIGPGRGGSYLVTKMLDKCEKLGIPVLTETRATEFIKDAKGNVAGVLADANEKKLQVNFKACVIAAGGFGGNIEKLKKRWPDHFVEGTRMHRFSCPTDEGDCLDMAEKIGIYIDYENMEILVCGPAHHPYSYTIYRIMRQHEPVWINLNGERWIDESVDLDGGGFFRLAKQPKGEMWAIVDEDLKELLGTRLYEDPRKYGASESDKWVLKDFRKDIDYEISLDEGGAAGKHARKADTLDALAKQIEVGPKTLAKTIETYNQYCDNKRDLDFAKKPEYLIPIRKPPFYAFWGQRFYETTHGGLVVNENMEVLRYKDKSDVVPGLFAAGDTAGGWTINGVLPMMAPGGGWMISTGYLAGVAAGKYLGKG
jgi:fumarate reductase flavoprotein subunit